MTMESPALRFCLVAALLLCCARAHAAVHIMNLENFRFSPNDITINAGDTIRFTNNSGLHDVTADDGSFGNLSEPAPWTFDQEFPVAGEFFVHCSVHSRAGRSRTTNMNARINVVGVAPQPFQINPGLNGSWLNGATPGQGYFIDIFPDLKLVFMAWFTWDTTLPDANAMAVVGDPGHRWVTAQGNYADDTANLNVTLTTGGVFDDPTPVVNQGEGTMTLQFTDCKNGSVTYNFTAAGVSGVVPITRIANDNVALCESMDGIDDS